MVFSGDLGGGGVFVEFLSGWKVLAQWNRALAEFGKFSWILVEFWRV
jgi:hypothetical protein